MSFAKSMVAESEGRKITEGWRRASYLRPAGFRVIADLAAADKFATVKVFPWRESELAETQAPPPRLHFVPNGAELGTL